jgi:signal transduction histidine kinase
MQKEFINVAAHELRTPVQPIIGLADTLYSKAQDTQQKEALEVIFRNARRLQRLVEDILDVTKTESNSLNLKRERFNLEKVIEDAINDINNSNEFQYCGIKGIRFFFSAHQDDDGYGSILVKADKGRICQVLSNF